MCTKIYTVWAKNILEVIYEIIRSSGEIEEWLEHEGVTYIQTLTIICSF